MAGTTIFGKVTDSGSGKPLGGVKVDVIVMDYPSRGSRLDLGRTRTAADGSYSLIVTLPAPVPPRVGAGAMVPTVWVEVHDGGAHVSRSNGMGLAGLAGIGKMRVDVAGSGVIVAGKNYANFRRSVVSPDPVGRQRSIKNSCEFRAATIAIVDFNTEPSSNQRHLRAPNAGDQLGALNSPKLEVTCGNVTGVRGSAARLGISALQLLQLNSHRLDSVSLCSSCKPPSPDPTALDSGKSQWSVIVRTGAHP